MTESGTTDSMASRPAPLARLDALTVVVVCDHAHVNGGVAKVAIDSALGLRGRGHRVILFAAAGPVDPRLADAGIEVVCLNQADLAGNASRLAAAISGLWNSAAAAALRRLLESLPASRTVVHCHGWAKALSPSVGPILADRRWPSVYTVHEYFLACPNGGFYNYQTNRICTLKALSPACVTTNCDVRHPAHKAWRVARQWVARGPGALPRGLQHIIFLNQRQHDLLAPYLAARSRSHIVANPVPVERQPRAACAGSDIFLFVGRLSSEKGGALLAAAARRAGVRVVYVGDGELRGAIEQAAPGAEFAGWCAPPQVEQWIRRARVLVFPSLWYECSPLTVVEAIAHGVPVITGDRCLATDNIRHDINGLHFAMGSEDALVSALEACKDDARIERLSRTAYDSYWSDPHTLDRHVDGLERVYEAALGGV